MKFFFSLFFSLVVGLYTCLPLKAETKAARAEMQQTLERILEIVKQNQGETHEKKRKTLLRELINPRFDFAEMSRRSLGTNWAEVSAADQTSFVELFSNLLAKTYLSKIESVEPGMVKITEDETNADKAMVKTLVTNKGQVFPIDYKLKLSGEQWQVYDVVIENIGLVANYRNEFAGIIRKEKFAGLMQKLREKIG